MTYRGRGRGTRRWHGALLTLALTMAFEPGKAVAAPVTVLVYAVENGGDPAGTANTASASKTVGDLGSDALVFVTAFGQAHYGGPLTGSGIRVSIVRDRFPVVQDDMFEGQSIEMTYRASVTHVCLLPQGKTVEFTGRTAPLGPLGSNNNRTAVRLEVVAIAAQVSPDSRVETCDARLDDRP